METVKTMNQALEGHHYILDVDGKTPKPCDLMTWAHWMETHHKSRHVADEQVGGIRVSTVFLGLNHQWSEGPPLIFETMIFGGPLDQEMDRCSTWEQAEAMHKAMMVRARASLA